VSRKGETGAGHLEQRLLVLITLGLVAFGLVMVFSATSASAAIGDGDPMTFLVKQGLYALAGLAALVALSRLDYHRIRPLAPMLLVGAAVLCAAVLVAAPSINGARRWFLLGPISVQPSEVAKLAVCIWLCWHLSRRKPPETFGDLMRPVGWVVLVFAGLIMLEPDLGTTISLFFMVTAILAVSGIPGGLLARAVGAALALGAVGIYMEPYRRARFLSFLDPWKDPEGDGFQVVQALIGIGSGGITGNGLGEGVAKVFYLPEAHTDMIFAIIGDELGLIGSTVVITAFAAFAWAGFRIGLRCRDPFGKRLAVGITSLVCGQAAVNLAAVLGIAPLTGIPLPFVSYGGSSLIMLLAGVGILLNIAVNERVVEARVRDRSRRNSRSREARPRSGGGAPRARSDGELRRNTRPRRVAAGS
jgi:cell division protein FtsW